MDYMEGVQKITALAGAAIAHGFHDEIIELQQVIAFDLRFNLRHPKIAAIYMLETPINGCHFEVVKRDGNRYHVGGDIAAKILGEEKAYMVHLEQIATQAKEQSGLIKQFCRKCDLFSKLYPQEAAEQQLKDRQKAMEEAYLSRAGGVLSRLSNVTNTLPKAPPAPKVAETPVVSAAVSSRIREKLRVSCNIEAAVAHAHLPKWVNMLRDKTGQVLGKGENWLDTDPTGLLRFEATGGKIFLSRRGKVVGVWTSYEDAHKAMALGLNTLPNPVLPLSQISYDLTVSNIPADKEILRKAIKAQVTANICDEELWDYLSK